MSGGAPITISDARSDLVGATMFTFRQTLQDYIQHTNWWKTSVGAGMQLTPAFEDAWWDVLPCTGSDPGSDGTPALTAPNDPNRRGRFRGNPYPFKPINARKAAQASSAMLMNCSQFIVEYAGDYLEQDSATGAITAIRADGTVDFFYDKSADTTAGQTQPLLWIRKVRWYGFPRDTGTVPSNLTGDTLPYAPPGQPDGHIRSFGPIAEGGVLYGTVVDQNLVTDVVPLRDICLFAGGGAQDFERVAYARLSGPPVVQAMPVRSNYADPTHVNSITDTVTGNGLNEYNHYVCAWGPNDLNRPKLLRLIVRLDDPNNRIADGQTFEYVVKLP
jgi:hypothetical protein